MKKRSPVRRIPQTRQARSRIGNTKQESGGRSLLVPSIILGVLTLAAYSQVFGCDFIRFYDDRYYVVDNPHLHLGLGLKGISWAFTTYRMANWHPLTWITHMIDYRLYGLNPLGHHVTNLLFHVAGTVLLFVTLSRATRSVGKSMFVAALFAVHPQHVESVAWVAERKDVLSGFFWCLTMYLYVRYTELPSVRRYLPVMLAFGLGLMSKSTLVTLPVVLLLLDYWPLGRMDRRWRLIWEKLPLVPMAAAVSMVTVIAEHDGGAVASLKDFPLQFRLINSTLSYVTYILKTVYPSGLAAFYPIIPENFQVSRFVASLVLLLAVSVAVILGRRRHPYLFTGWLWYLITFAPMIGFVQISIQARADRFSYIPLIGLFIMAAWGAEGMLGFWRQPAGHRLKTRSAYKATATFATTLLAALGVAFVMVMATCTWIQVGTWRDTDTLFKHAISVTKGNYLAYENVGEAMEDRGEHDQAVEYLSESVRLAPWWPASRSHLALALAGQGRFGEAIELGKDAALRAPDHTETRNNLALIYYRVGHLNAARLEGLAAIQCDPMSPSAHHTVGLIYLAQGAVDKALVHLRRATSLGPETPKYHNDLARALLLKGSYTDARRELQLCRRYGGTPDSRTVQILSTKMRQREQQPPLASPVYPINE